MFVNDTVSLEETPKYQDVLLQNLHADYKKIVLFNIVLKLIFGIVFSAILFLLFDKEDGIYTFFYIPFVITLLMSVYSFFAYKRKKYAFRQHDVINHSGLIYKTTNIVPYIRIQHIVVKQSWYAKKLHLATLKLYTAANDNIDISIPGITFEEAERWKVYVLNRIQDLDNESDA